MNTVIRPLKVGQVQKVDFPVMPQPRNIRVLVLDDDDKVWRDRIHKTLASYGMSCNAVRELSQFTAALQTSEYDVASIDCVIGERQVQDETLWLLREGDPDIGKIVFSAMVGDPRIELEAKHWGADRVVEKQAFGTDEDYVQAVLEVAQLSFFRRVLAHLKAIGRRTEDFPGGWPMELSHEQERSVYSEALDALMASFLEGEEDGDLMNLLKRRGVLREFDSPSYISLPFHAKLAELLGYVRVTPQQLSRILEIDTDAAERLLAGEEGSLLSEKARQNAYWLASVLDFVLRLSEDEPDLMPGFWTAKNLYAKSRNIPPWDLDGLRDYMTANGAAGLEKAVRWIRSY